jgi:hypothetical protein
MGGYGDGWLGKFPFLVKSFPRLTYTWNKLADSLPSALAAPLRAQLCFFSMFGFSWSPRCSIRSLEPTQLCSITREHLWASNVRDPAELIQICACVCISVKYPQCLSCSPCIIAECPLILLYSMYYHNMLDMISTRTDSGPCRGAGLLVFILFALKIRRASFILPDAITIALLGKYKYFCTESWL